MATPGADDKWLSEELLEPSIQRMRWTLIYLMQGLACDMPILEAYRHGLSVVLSRDEASLMLRRAQFYILYRLSRAMFPRYDPIPSMSDDTLVPCDQQLEIANADRHHLRSVVIAEDRRQGDGYILQFATFNEYDLLVEKYLIGISPRHHHAFVGIIADIGVRVEYIQQSTWRPQLCAFVEELVQRIAGKLSFSTDPKNAVIRDDFFAAYNAGKAALEARLRAQPDSLKKAQNFRCLAVLKQTILNEFQKSGKNYANIFYHKPGDPLPAEFVYFLHDDVLPEIIRFEKARPKICSACAQSGGSYPHCSRCGLAYYCSLKCQQKHWSTHKAACIAPIMDVLTAMFEVV